MRILIVNTDYPTFLEWLYSRNAGLGEQSFDEQMRVRNQTLFGVADFYSRNLRSLGHEAWDAHANNDAIQGAWASEHAGTPSINSFLRKAKQFAVNSPLRHLKPVLRPLVPARRLYDVLASQIRHYRPDVLLNQSVDDIPDDFLWEMKPDVRLVVGQIASPLISQKKFRSYDLMLSSLPNFVEHFRKLGVRSELHRLGFEPSILDTLKDRGQNVAVSFVGTLSTQHASRLRLFETVCGNTDLAWWGQGVRSLPKDSRLPGRHRGVAWGLQMYQTLRDSKITLNHHIDIAGSYANNMRLFESTGVGTMLITDKKDNLHEMFAAGKEVCVYSSAAECVEMIRYYLEHDEERKAISLAGQRRTLQDHNYKVRMQELIAILTRNVACRQSSNLQGRS